jgi:hypothetical protein
MDTMDSMDSLLSILVLWAGLLLMLWTLKKGLADVEASLDSDVERTAHVSPQVLTHNFGKPDAVADIIGHYMGTPIYYRITIGGLDYYFDHIQQMEDSTVLGSDERCLEPGIVYTSRTQ